MLSTLARQYRLGLLIAVIAALAVFVPAGFTQDPQNPDLPNLEKPSDNATGPIDLDHLENYLGQELTIRGEIDKIYNDMAFNFEGKQDKDKEHILVVNVMPESVHPEGGMQTDKPVSVTGTIRLFDSAALKSDYTSLDFGSAPVDKWEGKAVLVMGEREFDAALQPKREIEVAAIEREKPGVTEPEPVPEPVAEPTPVPEPEPQVAPREPAPTPPPATETTPEKRLPRTASPLAALGLSGLLSLATGLGIRLRRS